MSEFQRWSSEHRTIRAARDWNALLDHGLEKPASYIIRKNGNYYEAINGSTGKIDFGGINNAGGVSGTDAATVIQQAINALTDGGRIFIKAGTYVISSYIDVKSNITICGEGASTTLKASDNLPEKSPNRAPIIKIGGPKASNIELSNLKFDFNLAGNQASGRFIIAIMLWGSSNVKIHHNIFQDTSSNSVSAPVAVLLAEYLSDYTDNEDIRIEDNAFYIPNGKFGSAFCHLIYGKNIIISGNIVNCQDTIVLVSAAKGVIISGNIIKGSASLDISGGPSNRPTDTIVYEGNVQLPSDLTYYETGGYMIGLWQAEDGRTIRNIFIRNNVIMGDAGQKRQYGIDINQDKPTGTITNVEITGNLIDCGDGDRITQDAIKITYNTFTNANIVLERNRILNSVWRGVYALNCRNIKIKLNYLYGCGSLDLPKYGIYTDSCDQVDVIENTVESSYGANIVVHQCSNVKVEKNTAKNSKTEAGIIVYGSSSKLSENVIITNNHAYDDQATPTQTYGIILEYINGGLCAGNVLYGNVSGSILPVGNLTNFTISDNVGYKTEARGVAIIPANTRSHQVSFEMAGTPTVVKITPQFDVSGRWWISNLTSLGSGSGAFNFNRTYSGLYSGIIHWNAKYIP